MILGMFPQPNPKYDPKTQTCDDKGKEFDHRCPQLLDIEGDEHWVPKGQFARPDEVVIPDSEITLRIDYPLSKPANVPLKHDGGFTRKQLVHEIVAAYKRIYDEEEQTGGAPPEDGMSLNRTRTNGKHGIWGHYIEDLWLEGIMYNPARKLVTLAIGS